MKVKKPLKVGDKIVDFGQVCQIFKVDKRKKTIHYRPYFETQRSKTVSFSIPLSDLEKTQIRRPVSKKELKRIYQRLAKKSEDKKPINTSRLRKSLRENDVRKAAKALRVIWQDRQDETTNYTKTKKDIYRMALRRVANEVGFTDGLSLKEAKAKIMTYLEKGTS